MLFGRRKRQAPKATASAVEAADNGRVWQVRYEAGPQQALAELAGALAACRGATDPAQRALALAAARDALESLALESAEPALQRACQLFEQLLGSPRATAAQRLAAAELALETMTQLLAADPAERAAKAAALAHLESQAARTLAA